MVLQIIKTKLRENIDDPRSSLRTSKEQFIDTKHPRFVKTYPYIHVALLNETYTNNAVGSQRLRSTERIAVNIYVPRNQNKTYNEALEKEQGSDELLDTLKRNVLDTVTGEAENIIIESLDELWSVRPVDMRRVATRDKLLRYEVEIESIKVKGNP